MTYSSRTFLISCGFGSLSRVRSARSSSSSRMMSLQSSTHSSQMKTDGPAMSLRTSCWLLPQNEQYRSLPSSPLPRASSLIAVLLQPVKRYAPGYSTGSRCLQSRVSQFPLPVRIRGKPYISRLCDRLDPFREHGVDEPVLHGGVRLHEVVAVTVPLDALDGLTRVLRQDFVQSGP